MCTYLVLIPLFAALVGCQHLGDEPVADRNSANRQPGDATPTPWATTAKGVYKVGEEISVTIGTTGGVISVRTCCSNTPAYYVDQFDAGKWNEYSKYEVDCMKMCAQYGVSVSSLQPLHAVLDPVISEGGVYRFRFLYADEMSSDKELIGRAFTVE
jgi:hypothetical protein